METLTESTPPTQETATVDDLVSEDEMPLADVVERLGVITKTIGNWRARHGQPDWNDPAFELESRIVWGFRYFTRESVERVAKARAEHMTAAEIEVAFGMGTRSLERRIKRGETMPAHRMLHGERVYHPRDVATWAATLPPLRAGAERFAGRYETLWGWLADAHDW